MLHAMAVGGFKQTASNPFSFTMVEHKRIPQSDDGMRENKTIHSGQFMLSRVHENGEEDDEDDNKFVETDSDQKGYNFNDANKETAKTYRFGPRSTQTIAIDASLSKLFECLTLAFSGTITSPKWKQFRGLHLSVKDKVRLNNLIWREWHMQYIFRRTPQICHFATPLSDDIHTKPEAVVLEGKYWKRRLNTVTAEYMKWRNYYKEKRNHPTTRTTLEETSTHADLLEKVRHVNRIPLDRQQQSATDMCINDISDSEFSDVSFFTNLNQPFAFPNTKELMHFGFNDFIQPDLVQLQPNLEDFMDTLDPFQDILGCGKSIGSPLNISSSQNASPLVSSILTDQMSGSQSTVYPMETDTFVSTPDANSSTGSRPSNVTALGVLAKLLSGESLNDPSIEQLIQQSFQQTVHNFNNTQGGNNIAVSSVSEPSTPVNNGISLWKSDSEAQTNTSLLNNNINLNSILNQSQQNVQQPPQQTINIGNQNYMIVSCTDAIKTQTNPVAMMSQTIKKKPATVPSSTVKNNNTLSKLLSEPQLTKIAHIKKPVHSQKPATVTTNLNVLKKDVFAVPVAKPVTKPKQRIIAPAPPTRITCSPTTSLFSAPQNSQDTYLGQLLTKGTYPGATTILSVKKEPVVTSALNFPPIRPSEPKKLVQPSSPVATTPITVQNTSNLGLNLNTVGADFPTTVLLAAASQALGASNTFTIKDVVSLVASSKPQDTLSPNPTIATSPTARACDLSPAMTNSLPESPEKPNVSSPPSNVPSRVEEKLDVKEQKPVPEQKKRSQLRSSTMSTHNLAEKKRMCKIKTGFDMLYNIIPSLSQNPNAKVSKAAMLQKTAEFCKKLKTERSQMQNEAEILKQEIESLNASISVCQSQLPATGVPVTRQRSDHMKDQFEEYVRNRTLQNWKFWIFSIIITPLFESYNSMVSTASIDELCRTALAWLDQHCSLVALRPTVLQALTHLSRTTSILSDPSKMPEQATEAVTRPQNTSS